MSAYDDLLAFLRDPGRATVRAQWAQMKASAATEEEHALVSALRAHVDAYLAGGDREAFDHALSAALNGR